MKVIKKVAISIILVMLLVGQLPVSVSYGADPFTADEKYGNGDSGKDQQEPPKGQNDPSSDSNDSETIESSSTFFMFVKLVGALIVILGLIFLFYKVVSKRTRSFQSDGSIKNIGGVAVGPNRSVQLIRVGNEVLVVGVGDTVHLLKEITDPETVESFMAEDKQPANLQQNVNKMVKWAKENVIKQTDKTKTRSNKSFKHQLNELLTSRTREIENEIRKDSDNG